MKKTLILFVILMNICASAVAMKKFMTKHGVVKQFSGDKKNVETDTAGDKKKKERKTSFEEIKLSRYCSCWCFGKSATPTAKRARYRR